MSHPWYTLDSDQQKALRRRNIELRLLLLASGLLLAGILWVYFAQTGPLDSISQALSDNEIVNLTEVDDASDLAPALDALRDPEREKRIADRLATYLRGEGTEGEPPSLSSVEEIGNATAQDGSPLLRDTEYRRLESSFVVRTPSAYGWLVFWYALLFAVSFFLVHIYWRARIGRRVFGGGPVLLPVVMLLTSVGLVLMISLREPLREPLIFTDFVVGVSFGCVVLAMTARKEPFNWVLKRLKTYWYLPFVLSVILFLLLLGFGEGPTEAGEVKITLWFFQPAELIKILIVFFAAGFFARFDEHFRELRETQVQFLRPFSLPPLELFGTVASAVVVILGFFFGVGELGSALILSLTFFSLYAVARRGWGLAAFGFSCVIIGFYAGYLLDAGATTFFGYQPDVGAVSDRIRMWLSPWNNYATYGGDHLAHMLWAFAHGGLTGAGLGNEGIDSIPLAFTDGILAVVGEQLGALGVLLILGLFLSLFHRCFKIARGARSAFDAFLTVGFTLLLVVELIIIAGGISGLTPLTGVVTPFLSFGKTSMVANFFIVGVLLHFSSVGSQSRNRYSRPIRWIERVLLGVLAMILIRILFVQLVDTRDTLAQAASVPHTAVVRDTIAQGDTFRIEKDTVRRRRYSFNPRLKSLADRLGRGPIYDRNGIPLATSRWDSVRAYREVYERLGVDLDQTVDRSDSRYYPFGEFTYHLLGDIQSRHRWFASNTSFVERERRTHLLGYDDDYQLKKIKDARKDTTVKDSYRDYRPLVPLLRSDWKRNIFKEKDRSLQLTIDIQLQQRVAKILDRHLQELGRKRAAVVLMDAETGGLLASVTHPWRGALDDTAGQGASLDRARFGKYPPGSSFKIVTAASALQTDGSLYRERYPFSADRCRGFGRETLNMEQAVICSSNDYFSSLAEEEIGSSQLLETAAMYDIKVGQPNNPESLQYILDQTAIGQGEVTATPVEMARVATSIAREGEVPSVHWVGSSDQELRRIFSKDSARRLGTYMRSVVTHTEGTAHNIASQQTGLAGKTGTAEIKGQRPFAWFIGYAPANAKSQQVAVAVMIEEGGGGSDAAAPVAADAVLAAQDLGYGNE